MYCPVCGMVHIKEPLLLIGTNSPRSSDSASLHKTVARYNLSIQVQVLYCFKFYKRISILRITINKKHITIHDNGGE